MKIPPSAFRLVAALALAAAFGAAAASPADSLADGDRQCLACHGQPGARKTLADGAAVPLHVDAKAFAGSVHAGAGCGACHGDVELKTHPGASRTYADARAMAVALSQSCRTCHEASFEAHTQGVHGSAKAGASAPLCVTCHGTHDIARASVGPALRDVCLGCHAEARAQHAKWLPNSRLHFDVVSCAACHVPGSGKRLELRFYDAGAREEVAADGKAPAKAVAAIPSDKALDAAQLRQLVRVFDDAREGKVALVGRIEPATGAEGHRLLAKGAAVKDCTTCHRRGSDAFQNVSLSVVGADGQRVRYETQKGVLHEPTSLQSVPGFYAMGGTRIQALDVLLGLALFAGISAPLGHFVMRQWMRRKDRHHD